jgi:hypothetical protein
MNCLKFEVVIVCLFSSEGSSPMIAFSGAKEVENDTVDGVVRSDKAKRDNG